MMNEHIPQITDPLGKSWPQLNTANILIDGDHALMSAADAAKLPHYDYSFPDGVYAGKMWIRNQPQYGEYLLWYTDHPEKPDCCQMKARKLLIVE
ncbi:hypothetical protein [Morganella phage Mecenats66]|nr:hypothetical protein [Morganella phage Mecenats66]